MAQVSPSERIMRTYLEDVVARGRLDLIPDIAHEDMVDEARRRA